MIYALLSQIKLCRDYALFEGHFLLKFGVWGQKYILLDRAPTPHERLSAIYIFNALFMDTPLAYLARHLTYTPNL